MKFKLNLILWIIICSGLVFPQSIQVITPKNGVTWYIGDTVKITWKSVNLKDTLVKINIFRNSIEQANFIHQLTGPDNGSITWTIGPLFKPGKYILRVKGATSNVKGDSGVFNIAVKPTPPPPPGSGNTMVIPGPLSQTQQLKQGYNQLKDPPKTGITISDMMLKPDLIVKKISIVDTEPIPENVSDVMVTIVIMNTGHKDIKQFEDWFSVSIKEKSGWGGHGINYGGGLKAGDVVVFNQKVHLYRDMKGFIPEYSVIVDPDNKISEENENNNQMDFSIQLK